VAETEVGKQIALDIIRKGEKQSVKVKSAEAPDAMAPKET
jgi:S1-C subfamily serine protease